MQTPTAVALASQAVVDHVAALARQAVAAWRTRWGVDAGCVVSACAVEGDVTVAETACWLGCGEPPSAALHWPAAFEDRLATLLFNTAVPAGTLGAEAVEHVAQALRRSLLVAWGADGSCHPLAKPPRLSRWLAPVQLSLEMEGVGSIAAVVCGAVCRPAAARRAATALPRADTGAFHALPVAARLVVGGAEVSVPDVASLQPGDVLVLDSRVHDPLELRLPDDHAALPVFLGRLGARRAVQLTVPSKS